MADKKSWRDYYDKSSGSSGKNSEKTSKWRDYYNPPSGGNFRSSDAGGTLQDYFSTNAEKTSNYDITSRVNNWLRSHNSYVRDYENRFSGRKYSYDDAYVSDSADWLNTMSERKKTADAEADAILAYIEQNKNHIDRDWARDVFHIIKSAKRSQGKIVDIASEDDRWWNSFGTEELLRQYGSAEKAYTATGKAIAKRNDQRVLDTEAYAAELEELKKFVDEAYDIGGWYEYYQAGKTDYLDYDKSEDPHRLEVYNRLQNEYGGDVSLASDDYIQRGRYLQEAKRVQEQAREDEEYAKQLAPYLALMQNDDFAEKSAFKTKYLRPAEKYTPAGSNHTYVIDTGYEDIWYDYINRQDDAIKLQGLSDMAGYAEFAGYDKGYLKEMEDDEIKIYNYLYATQGKESADEFVGLLTSELAYRTRKRIQEENALYAKEHPIHASAWSILSSPAKSISAIGQIGDYIDDGKIDENAGYNKYSYQNSAIRNTVANNIAKPENGAWGKVGSWTYQLGMSMGDFVMNTAVSGGNSVIASALMASGAMADTVIAAKDRGLSDDQAFTLGVIAGGAEIITEKFSLEALLKGDLSKGTLQYILTNAFTEGTEEVSSSLINLFADVIISKDQSEWEMSIKKYLEEHPGTTETDAFTNVLFDTAASLGLDFIGGQLMGGFMGSVGAGINYVTEVAPALGKNKEAAEKYGKSVPEMIKAGLSSEPKSRGYDLANFYQSKINSGKELSGYEIRQLKEAVETDAAIELHGKIEEAHAQFVAETKKEAIKVAKARLTELGETGDVDAIADAVAKKVMSERLTSKERKLLVNSFGSQVAKEIAPAENESTYKSLDSRAGDQGRFGVSESGKATVRSTGQEVNLATAEVTKVGNGEITFKLEDGSEAYAGDIDFASDDQSYLVSAVSSIENITPAAATAMLHDIVDTSKPLGKQLNGIDEAFTYGYNGYSEADLKAGSFTGGITKKQMMSAYKLGQSARNANTEEADAPKVLMRTALQAKLTATERAARQRSKFDSRDVGVYFMDGKNITKVGESGGYKGTGQDVERRMAAVNYAKLLSKLGIGNNYYFFESYKNANGDRVYKDADGNEVSAPNGFYREGTSDIYIDLNAGNEGQGVALFTLGHELTHFIKEWSEKKFKVLADFLVAEYGNTDLTMRERVLAKQAELEGIRKNQDDYKPVKYQEAFEEVVADAMSAMLADGNLHEKLAELRTKDKGLVDKIIEFFSRMIAKFQALYKDLDPEQRDARDVRAMKDSFDRIQQAFAEALVEASDNFRASMESVVESGSEAVDANEIITDGAVVTDGNGEKHSIRSMKHDIAEGKMFEDLKKVCGWTDAQVKTLRTQLTDLVEYMIPYRNILDMNESYGMEGRRFSPYKPNSDPLYKISMDFSTLCSKRLLTQYVIEQLQLRENRPMSAEEQMAIRDMLNEYRKVEKGLQVACAMCYVEAARLKSPKQMQRWLDDPAPHLINYFALKNTEFNDSVKKAQADFKESRGYDRKAPKKDMKQADVRELNKIGPRLRAEYQPSAEEQAIIEKAKSLPNSTYLTAGNLASLSETDPVIYAAYTSLVRTATRSKSLETDEPYYYGDSTRDNGNGIIVSDSFIEAVNRENGMRFSSWSDWRIQHMLDYITAVIDNSVRGAAMHGYTKFPDEVRVLGKTGMMFNMSGVAGTQTGLNEDGTLNFSETESIDVNEAIQLRKEFPETAGLQCIGVGNEHIIALLRSDIIDYVIPYHVSGLNATLRRMADIHGWKDYTSTQHAVVDKNIKLEDAADKEHWHEEPVFSEFFVGYDTGMSGIEAMRASAEKYKQICRDRGLKPKFEQFANEDNYWKLLIDRKMINQQTGNLIRQKAVTPTFDFGTIKGIVDKFVQNYDAGLEGRALNHIVENWDSIPQRIKDLKKKGGSKAKKTAKAVDTLANETLAAQPKKAGVKNSDRVSNKKLVGEEYSSRETDLDTEGDSAYDNAKKEANQEVKIYGQDGKAEDHASFIRRMHEGSRRVKQIGKTVFAYEPARAIDTSGSVSDAARELRRLGIKYFYHNGLEYNHNGFTYVDNGAICTIEQQVVGIYAKAFGDGMEFAGHEAFHVWKKSAGWEAYVETLRRNISITSSVYGLEQADTVLREYFGGDVEALSSDESKAQFLEELYALVSGKIHSGTNEAGLKTMFKDYSAVKAAWDDMIKKQTAQKGQKFSERDSAGNKLSKQQQEFFIDSVVRDKDGNLLVMYHGTSKGGYTVFDTYYGNHGLFGIGSYFTDNKEIAKTYTKKGRGTSPQVYEAYLDIKNPLDMDAQANPKEWAEAFPDVDFPESGTNEAFYRAVEEWCEDEMMYKWDAAETIQAGIESGMGYDGITHIGGGRVDPNGVRHRVYIAFQPEQIKRTDNQNPTNNPDIRYSERSGDAVSNRTLLANAFEGLSQNSDEYAMIQEYRNRIKLLEEQEEKLDKINAEIREIRFTSGKYDAKKLAELEAKKKEISKAITRHDKKLLEMEVSAPFRKVIEQERKNEAQKTKAHIAEIQQNKQMRAEQAELRHKVRKVIRDLDKILKRGTKEQNVKEDMKGFVSKALELADYLFTDHISNDDLIMRGIDADLMRGDEAELVRETEEIIQQIQDNYGTITEEEYKRLTARKKRNMEALRELLTKQRNRRLNTPVYNLFDDLVTEYAKLKNSDQDAVKAAYNPEVERFLRSYMGDTMDGADSDKKTLLQNMRVADMTTQELEHLYYAYTMVLHSVRDANKLFVQGKAESVQKMADQIFADFSQRKAPEKKLAIIARNIANKIGWDYEKLYYALDRIGSEAFTELVMNVANSENIVMQDVIEAAIFRDEMVEKYGFNNWAVSKKIDREFLDNTGKKFKLTLGQLMALYAYSRRKGAWDHIEYGGFVFGDEELTNPNPADSYKLTREQCEAITDLLTAEQKGYVEAMQKFLSETMGGKGNEVSMMLYGIKMFTEKNYFPIKVAGQFKPQAQEAQAKAAAGFSSMTNAGFTHEQNPNAKAPFVLEGFNEVWADHVNEMSRYHGTVPALEDMRRVMNRSSYSEAGTESMSIKQLMENAFGKEAVDYFDALYREANSGAVRDKLQADSHKLLSLFRKNSVAYSLSVLIQQPASLVRAYAMIDRKYFGLKGFGVITSGVIKAAGDKWTKAHTNAYNEMLKYATGVTMAKEIGGFDTHTGSSIRGYLLDTKKSFGQKVKTDKHGKVIGGIKAAYEFVDDNAIANLPNVADKIAWIEIWNACKRETIAKHKDLVPTSDAFLKIVGDRFTEVIRATQVYDSMFSKSPMLKSKNLAVQYLVSFMNEPNTVANMAEKAVRDMTKGGRMNWMSGLKTAHVVVHSIIFTNLLKSIIYAMRDDDEDETYIEKYIEALSSGLFNDFIPFNYIPIARDVWSLAQGYDVERADMAIVADAIDAIYGVSKNWFADTDSMTEDQLEEFDKKVIEANWKLVESIAAFFGIPVKNIRREINGFMDHARIASKNAGMTTLDSTWDKIRDSVIDSIPFMQSDRTKGDKLYEAMITGDTDYLDRIKGTYKTDDAYESAVIKALRENDPRIDEAAQAGVNGDSDERNRIFREIKAELGARYANFVISAINSEVSAIRNEEKPEKVDGKYDAFDFMSAVTQKDTKAINDIREDIISTYVANNKTQEQAEKEFVSATKSAMKEMYLYDMLSESEASSALKAYCPDGDDPLDNDDIYWIIRKWDYEKENGSSDGYSQYNDFRDAVQTGKSLQLVIDEYVSHGIEEKTLASQITSHFKPLYKEMSYSDRVSLKRRLLDAYDALGYNRSKKSKDIDEWLDD